MQHILLLLLFVGGGRRFAEGGPRPVAKSVRRSRFRIYLFIIFLYYIFFYIILLYCYNGYNMYRRRLRF